MFMMGVAFAGLTGLGVFLLWRKKLYDSRWFLKLMMFALPLPIIANELGWMAAEVGRQPWIVYRLFKTSEAISTAVPAWQVLFSIIMFSLIYILLFSVWVFLLRRAVRKGPDEAGGAA
jgi:cytochrome d ubiquinol oxidase subunit I